MAINLDTCSFVIWGFKHNTIDTFKHIFEAFYRALKFMGKRVLWLDQHDDISGLDFSNTFFISMNCAFAGMPRRKDCFYAIHNVDTLVEEYLQGFQMMHYGIYVDTATADLPKYGWIELATGAFMSLQLHCPYSAVIFRWGTNLLPPEIEANKPSVLFRRDSKVINYIGCAAPDYKDAVAPFRKAAEENGIAFNHIYHGKISTDDHIRLIRESYMAPAVCTSYQTKIGFITCRLFKNISYGQYGITNNIWANKLFGDKLIYNPDAEALFYQARNQLPEISLAALYSLMDEVAAKHTFLNKVDALLAAAKISMENRS